MDAETLELVRTFCTNLGGRLCTTRAILDHGVTHGLDANALGHELQKAALAELSDCATRGIPVEKMRYGKMRTERPWVWHAPDGTSPGAAKAPALPSWRDEIRDRLVALEQTCLRILTIVEQK